MSVCLFYLHIYMNRRKLRFKVFKGSVLVKFCYPAILLEATKLRNFFFLYVLICLAAKYGVKAEDILLVHDELDKPLGKIAIKHGGSARWVILYHSVGSWIASDSPRSVYITNSIHYLKRCIDSGEGKQSLKYRQGTFNINFKANKQIYFCVEVQVRLLNCICTHSSKLSDWKVSVFVGKKQQQQGSTIF